jgi:hypothetical protein
MPFVGLVGPDKAVLGVHPGGCSLTQARLTTNRDKAIVGQMHFVRIIFGIVMPICNLVLTQQNVQKFVSRLVAT